MILLVTPIARRHECAAALHQATGENVVIADSLLRATTLLRTDFYTAAVFDRSVPEFEPHEVAIALDNLGSAIPVQINLAISGIERLVGEVKSAIRFRKLEEATARGVATRLVYSELNDTLTTLLLESELALETTGLTPAAGERLTAVRDTTRKLRSRLESSAKAAGAGV
jgi:hypothetical protein